MKLGRKVIPKANISTHTVTFMVVRQRKYCVKNKLRPSYCVDDNIVCQKLKKLVTGCKESQFYSLPIGQAVACMY